MSNFYIFPWQNLREADVLDHMRDKHPIDYEDLQTWAEAFREPEDEASPSVNLLYYIAVLWIRNDLFRVTDPALNFPSSGSRQKFRIHADPDPTFIN